MQHEIICKCQYNKKFQQHYLQFGKASVFGLYSSLITSGTLFTKLFLRNLQMGKLNMSVCSMQAILAKAS